MTSRYNWTSKTARLLPHTPANIKGRRERGGGGKRHAARTRNRQTRTMGGYVTSFRDAPTPSIPQMPHHFRIPHARARPAKLGPNRGGQAANQCTLVVEV